MQRFLYRGRRTNEISFPLGGLGTGCIGLAGNGRLIDWEIDGRPNKGSFNGFSHFAVKAEADGKVVDARVLHGDLHPPYTGELGRESTVRGSRGFGFGPHRENLAGMPHFKETEFLGQFPLAELTFRDERFPGRVRLKAFNPFIPLDDRDSGIPGAFFAIEVENTTDRRLDYTIAATLGNPLPVANRHTIQKRHALTLLRLDSDALQPVEAGFGDLTIATDAADVSVQRYWFRGAWFDSLEVYWREFASPGRIKDRAYPDGGDVAGDQGMLAAHVAVEPGAREQVRFLITWSFPNVTNYWNSASCETAHSQGLSTVWRNYYATIWENSGASAEYGMRNWDRLYERTLTFKDTLFSSSLPPAALEAVSANLAVLKSPTVLRLEDGTFYGWEGCCSREGCCEGSCTHLWNYA